MFTLSPHFLINDFAFPMMLYSQVETNLIYPLILENICSACVLFTVVASFFCSGKKFIESLSPPLNRKPAPFACEFA
jgi:hypothetical protein